MTVQNSEEIKGTFQENPFAELLTEISQARLSGSIRLAHVEEKVIFYFKNGEVIFAVSNLRQHRLFDLLLQTGKISKESLTEIPNFTNDLELGQTLVEREILTKAEVDWLFSRQIEGILTKVLEWKTGAWSFSHLARAKEGIEFKIETARKLSEYARNLSDESIIKRFRSFEERFSLAQTYPVNFNLLPQEAFLMSRIDGLVRITDIRLSSGLPEKEILRSLYILWLSGFLVRKNWNSAFSETRIREMLSARLTLKKEALEASAQKIEVKLPASEKEIPVQKPTLDPKPEVKNNESDLLEKYLKQVEEAESYYEILGVKVKANLPEIKAAYFNLAKQYHPDKYHQTGDAETQKRVQNAFTELARAYDTLKDDKAREVYDFKLRKYLEYVQDDKESGRKTGASLDETENARYEFERGFEYLMDDDYDEALPYLTRAAQMAPNNARYRAYYGKVLSGYESERHKAEAELQAAIKLDPATPTYRIMLVEFFIDYKLMKRAEGELQRILNAFPGNKEAEALLASLR
ncbi:MAG: DnaJ domain-containing protein [Pyrinomonadaceae bacterium]|nr:DnaJ domain-containing protein [Pyrinomonadaceae bacterium]